MKPRPNHRVAVAREDLRTRMVDVLARQGTPGTPGTAEQIRRIAERYAAIAESVDQYVAPTDVALDLALYHARMPLALDRLEQFDDFNLAHDVGGIRRAVVEHFTSVHAHTFAPRCGLQERAS
jgi:hypothetical protein